jgi:hypothetical protein
MAGRGSAPGRGRLDNVDDIDDWRRARKHHERTAPSPAERAIAIGVALLANVLAGALLLRAPALDPASVADAPIEVVWVARAPVAGTASNAPPASEAAPPDAALAGHEASASQPSSDALAPAAPSSAATVQAPSPIVFRGGQIPADEEPAPLRDTALRDDEKGRLVPTGPDALERGDFGRHALVVGGAPEAAATLDDRGRPGAAGTAPTATPAAECATLRARLRDGDGEREAIVRALVALGCD